MAQLIDQISNSGLFAQSAYSAAVATNDDLGRKISTTYLTAVDLSPYATETLVEETSGSITSLIPTDYYPDTNPSGFITGVDLTPYATTAEVDTLSSILSGAIDYVSANAGDEFPASANEAITAYQTNSGNYLTAISIPESATWNDVSTTVQTNSATWGQGGGGGASYTSPSSTIWISADKIESTNSAYIPSHQEDVLLTATKSWSSINGYATLANTNKVYFWADTNRASAFDNEGTFLNSSYNSPVWAETEYPPIKLYTNTWVSVKFSAYSAGIMDAYVVELARKNEVNSALNKKLDSSAFTGYYPSNNPSGFAKSSDVVSNSSINLFDGRIIGINNQYLMGCDSAYNRTLVGTSAATGTKTASAYVGTGHQGINIQISARNNGNHYINWTAFSENGSNLSAGQLDFNSTTANRISGFEFNSPLAENISGITLYGNNIGFTAYSAYTIDVKPLASQDNITFLSGAIDYVSANVGEPDVKHDSSLSGNGTVNSPLGVVPGYNETVLWEGSFNTTAQSGTVSESISAFDRVRFYANRTQAGDGRCYECQEFVPNFSNGNNTCFFYPLWTDIASNTVYENIMYITFTGDNFGFLRGWSKNGTTETTGVSTYGFYLKKIVGINRKQ